MAEVTVREVQPMTVMSLPFSGSYDQARGKLQHLMSWLLRIGHPHSDTPLGLFYDDPSKVAEDALRAEVCLPIEEECEGQEDIVRKPLPTVTAACAMHQGPHSESRQTYEEIFTWMAENGYRYVEGEPCREVYQVIYGQVTDPAEFVTEIQVPVEKV